MSRCSYGVYRVTLGDNRKDTSVVFWVRKRRIFTLGSPLQQRILPNTKFVLVQYLGLYLARTPWVEKWRIKWPPSVRTWSFLISFLSFKKPCQILWLPEEPWDMALYPCPRSLTPNTLKRALKTSQSSDMLSGILRVNGLLTRHNPFYMIEWKNMRLPAASQPD